MMFKTHLMFSLFIGLLIFGHLNLDSYSFILILVLAGSLPDIDHAKSFIGKKLFFISFFVNLFFGHRRLIHSIIFASILSLIIKIIFGNYWIPFYLGYLSHLFLDSLTKRGLQIFYPFKFKINGFIKTKSLFEGILLFGLIILNIYYIVRLI